MDLALIVAAAEHAASAAEHLEEHEKSEVPFFVAGSLWALVAVAISVYGFRRPDFPETAAKARAVMSAGAVLMMAAVGCAIYVAL